jgi:hypothetical protein
LLTSTSWEARGNAFASRRTTGNPLATAPAALLPAGASGAEGAHLQLGAAMQAARAFGGGDYFDVIPLKNGCVALCIADVSGKSARAQARLPLLKYSLRALAPLYDDPAALITRLNETLAPDLQTDLFIGLCYVVLDMERGTLTWCNAGHIAPLLITPGADAKSAADTENESTVTALETLGPALGPFPEIPYTARTVPWSVGDRLLLFTDGLSDALSYGGSEDGEWQVRWTAAALEETLWSDPNIVANRLLQMAMSVIEEKWSVTNNLSPLRRLSEPAAPPTTHRDDITVIVARFAPAGMAENREGALSIRVPATV